MTDDTFDPEGDRGDGPAADARAAPGRSAVGAVWQEGAPGHWVIKLSGLPGAPRGQEVAIGRPDASNHSASVSHRISPTGELAGIAIAWIQSPAGDTSGVGRVMWQSFAAAPAAAGAANDNGLWIADPSGAGVIGSEPAIADLSTGETLVTWVGTDGHAYGRLLSPADADTAALAGDGSDAPERATVNGWLGDLGPVGAAPDGGRRLQVAELRPGTFAVMWLALGESGPVLRGSQFLSPTGDERGDDLVWSERPLAEVRLPHGFAGQFSLAPAGNGAGPQAILYGPAGTVAVDVVDYADGALAREDLGEPAPAGLPGPAAGLGGAAIAALAPGRLQAPLDTGNGDAPTVEEEQAKPARTALAIATAPDTGAAAAPAAQPVPDGPAVAWQPPAVAESPAQPTFPAPEGPQLPVPEDAAPDVAPAVATMGDGVAGAYVQADDRALVVRAYDGNGAEIAGKAVVDPGDGGAIAEIAIASSGKDKLTVVFVQQPVSDEEEPAGYGHIMLQRFAVPTTHAGAHLLPLGRDGRRDGDDGVVQIAVETDDGADPEPVVGRGPAVASVDGELAIVWVEPQGEGETIRGCVIDRGGDQALRIDLTSLLDGAGIAKGSKPTLLAAGDDDFLVSWLQCDGDDGYVVMSALYRQVDAGRWLAPEQPTRLKAFDSEPTDYAVALSGDDDGLAIDVTWQQDGEHSGNRVYTQSYDTDGRPLGPPRRIAGDDAPGEETEADTVAAAGLPGQIVVVYAEQDEDGELDLETHVIDTGAGEDTAYEDKDDIAPAADGATRTVFSTGVDQEAAINPLAEGIAAGLAISSINGVPIATAAPVDVGCAWVQLREDGWLTVAPDAGYTGPIAFEYTVTGAPDRPPSRGHVVVNVEPGEAPAAVTLLNQVAAVPEDISTAADLKVADIAIAEGELGTDGLSLTGLDAGMFKIVGNALYLKEGIELDFETKPTLSVEIKAPHGIGLDAAANFTLNVENADDAPVPEALDDSFLFAPGYGDANGEHEVVDLTATGYSTFQELLESGALAQVGDDVVITLGAGDAADPHTIALKGVQLSALGDLDFKFS